MHRRAVRGYNIIHPAQLQKILRHRAIRSAAGGNYLYPLFGGGFYRLGAFPYSPEDGTPAATFPDQIPEEEKTARYNELMELQQEVSLSRQARFVGKTLDVLIDAVDEETGERIGRSYRDAPEIDGEVAVSGAESALPGDMIRVRITGSSEYDLSGEMIHE